MKYLFFSLRPKQWIKNLFIFLPLIFGKKLFDFSVDLKAITAFCLFSLASSIVYLINDIIDFEEDKLHPMKRLRPIASGKTSIKLAKFAALILGIPCILLSFIVNVYFGWIVIAYILFNLVYSKILKRVVIIDILCIGGFFLLRIIAGSIVAGVQLSHWILFMTILLALFLGLNKRRQELRILGSRSTSHRSVLSKYRLYFIDQIIAVITSSIAVVYILYTVDARTTKEFGTENLMYSIPFVYYGIFRYLYLIHRIRNDGDPTRILVSDRMLQIDIALWAIVCVAVIYFKF